MGPPPSPLPDRLVSGRTRAYSRLVWARRDRGPDQSNSWAAMMAITLAIGLSVLFAKYLGLVASSEMRPVLFTAYAAFAAGTFAYHAMLRIRYRAIARAMYRNNAMGIETIEMTFDVSGVVYNSAKFATACRGRARVSGPSPACPCAARLEQLPWRRSRGPAQRLSNGVRRHRKFGWVAPGDDVPWTAGGAAVSGRRRSSRHRGAPARRRLAPMVRRPPCRPPLSGPPPFVLRLGAAVARRGGSPPLASMTYTLGFVCRRGIGARRPRRGGGGGRSGAAEGRPPCGRAS